MLILRSFCSSFRHLNVKHTSLIEILMTIDFSRQGVFSRREGAHRSSPPYLWWSCCDRPPGSISASHCCPCVRTAPSARVRRGRLKTITTRWHRQTQQSSAASRKKQQQQQKRNQGNKYSTETSRVVEDVGGAAPLPLLLSFFLVVIFYTKTVLQRLQSDLL